MAPAFLRIRGRRQLAASALPLGGVLISVALFLPCVRVHYSPIAGDPAYTFFDYPGRDLALMVQVALVRRNATIELLLDPLFLCGIPIALAATGAAVLWKRSWVPRPRARLGVLILVVLGAGWALITCLVLLYIVGSFDVIRGTRTLEYGAGVAILGYLCALGGTILLPHRSEPSQR